MAVEEEEALVTPLPTTQLLSLVAEEAFHNSAIPTTAEIQESSLPGRPIPVAVVAPATYSAFPVVPEDTLPLATGVPFLVVVVASRASVEVPLLLVSLTATGVDVVAE